jgi:hypothetical protein
VDGPPPEPPDGAAAALDEGLALGDGDIGMPVIDGLELG